MNRKFLVKSFGVIVAASAGLLSVSSHAGNLDLKVSKNSASAEAQFRPEAAEWRADLGYLYHEGGRHIAHLGFHAVGETALGNLPATVAVGAKGIIFEQDKTDGGALTIGGDIRMNIPDVPGLAVEASAHYAPSILSFDDAEGLWDFRAQVNYRVIPKADVIGGYQIMNADQEQGSHFTLDEGAFIGIRVHF